MELRGWKEQARKLRAEIYALYLAYRDPRVPWYAKILTAALVGYALSPIDLIPDFIPVIGVLDDLLLLPIGIKLAIKMIPADVLEEYRTKAKAETIAGEQKSWIAAGVVICIWILLIYLIVKLVFW